MTLEFDDHQRAARLVIAKLDGDALAFDAAMADAIGDDRPGAHAGLVLALAQLAAEVLAAHAHSETEAADILRQSLGTVTANHLAEIGKNSD